MYWFSDSADNVLYVGKAKNLKNRVKSYSRFIDLNNRIKEMVGTAQRLRWEELKSDLEAILIEAELIRTHQPQFNIQLKDDKTPLYILITKEAFPRVLTLRKKELLINQHPSGTVLGPFPSAYKVREVLSIARRIFPWCNAPRPILLPETSSENILANARLKPCFFYHLDLCPGVCCGHISAEDYQQHIQALTQFLKGKTKQVISLLKTDLAQAAANQAYEKAALLRDQIELVKTVTDPAYKLKPEMGLPLLRDDVTQESLVYLRKLLRDYLHLPKHYPLQRIEGYDVSNTQGTLAAVAQVVLLDGQTAPDQYRLFNIRSLNTPNDYAMLQEALIRRQNHPEWNKPDLVVIDGGKGQLRAALKVWQWGSPVISIAKDPDRMIIPHQELSKTGRAILTYTELPVRNHQLGFRLLQLLRDEAHRFSKKQHDRRRTKDLLR